jgi:hypothetical protein
MSIVSTITNAGNALRKGADGAVHAAGNSAIADGASAGLAAMGSEATGSLNDALSTGVANSAAIAMAQVQASTEQFKINAAEQEANSVLHMAEKAVAAAVKFQNQGADDAKDAI